MSNYSMKGVVESITPVQERGNFSWRNLMLKTSKEVGDKIIEDLYEFQVSGKNLDTISESCVGCEAEIFFNIRSREYNGKYYTNLSMWKMTYEAVEQSPKIEKNEQKAAKASVADVDDLPF